MEAYVALADLYTKQKRSQEAMKALDDAADAVPNSTLIKLTLAAGHAANSDWSSAIVVLDEAVIVEPDNPEIHFRMAQMYRKMEAYKDAQTAIDEVLRIDATFPGVSVEQGYLMELSGNVDQAILAYEAALKAAPEDLNAKIRVAAASIYKKNYTRAKDLLTEVLEANADSAEANFYMGEVFRLENSPANAIPYLDAAVKNDAKNPLYWVRYGAAFSMLHDIVKARQALERAKELDADLPEVYLRRGELLLRSGSARDAIIQLNKSLQLNPDIEGAHLLIGRAWEELANLHAAEKAYQQATQNFPTDAEAHYRLGVVSLQTKGNKAAIPPLLNAIRLIEAQRLNKSVPIPPWFSNAYYEIGKAQKSTGAKTDAIASFKTYLEIAPERAVDRKEVQALLTELSL